MTAIVFVGPTLRPEDIEGAGDIIALPPVAQGDVFRAALRRPRAIGIIDGYFSGAASVWHKEILWAMSEGVPVFGAASMGALRAAELHEFGMRGIGRIFESFRDGVLEDDDEVAVVHGPAEIGFAPASDAMVNIRATLALAVAKSVIGAESRRALVGFAKGLFFADRNWPVLFAGEAAHGVGEPELAALGDWLPEGRVDQKRLDALEMLAAMRAAAAAAEPASPAYHFEWTSLWGAFVGRSEMSASAPSAKDRSILDELRLQGPEAYRQVEAKALMRSVAASGAARPNKISRQDARAALKRLREQFGLYARADLDRWMAANDLDASALEALIDEEAAVEALRARAGRSIQARLIDELRLGGAYPGLADRALKKEAAVAASAQPDSSAPAGLRGPALRLWYFENRLRRAAPDDIAEYAARIGFADASALDAAIYREWLFLKQKPQD
jgi:hypothetical protein